MSSPAEFEKKIHKYTRFEKAATTEADHAEKIANAVASAAAPALSLHHDVGKPDKNKDKVSQVRQGKNPYFLSCEHVSESSSESAQV